MHDSQGRIVRYLRLSLTSACSMRCVYCRPAVDASHRGDNVLKPQAIEHLVRHMVKRHGLVKVRLTGGEPTARPDLMEIIQRLAGITGLDDLAMTTNGLTLGRHAEAYRRAGLRRVNVSLDSLNATTFKRMTGVAGLDRVLAGIDAACEAGLDPIRLNTVVVTEGNADELPALVRFAASRGLEIRFIELMPMGPLAGQWAERYVSQEQMRQRLAPMVEHWQAIEQGHDSAQRYRVRLDDGRSVVVGFITPMSCNFCAQCNRLRITAVGDLYPCLMDQPRGSIVDAVHPDFDPDRFDAALDDALSLKLAEHPMAGYTQMTILGG
ncbi:MAG: GTP 3',8-cyclase MoaA [Phycisphaeraceae bacterium]|nr:GTP 3',8-cyclase MoaA [Phycisphaeraceae bacterium]